MVGDSDYKSLIRAARSPFGVSDHSGAFAHPLRDLSSMIGELASANIPTKFFENEWVHVRTTRGVRAGLD